MRARRSVASPRTSSRQTSSAHRPATSCAAGFSRSATMTIRRAQSPHCTRSPPMAAAARMRVITLAEIAYLHGEKTQQRPYLLAAAIYSFAFLFPEQSLSPRAPTTRGSGWQLTYTASASPMRLRPMIMPRWSSRAAVTSCRLGRSKLWSIPRRSNGTTDVSLHYRRCRTLRSAGLPTGIAAPASARRSPRRPSRSLRSAVCRWRRA